MTKQIFKVVLAGILAGLAIFIMPFLLIKTVIFFLLIGAIFRLVSGRGGRWHRGGWGSGIDPHKRYAFAKRWQTMDTNERKSFMDKMEAEMFNSQNDRNIEIR